MILISSVAHTESLNNKANNRLTGHMTTADHEYRTSILRSEAFKRSEPSAIEELMKIGFRYQFYDTGYADSLFFDFPNDFLDRSEKLGYLYKDFYAYDFSEVLTQIMAPTLLIGGEIDPLSDLALPAMDSLIPNSTIFIIPESGHFPFIEKKEACLMVIRGFMEEG